MECANNADADLDCDVLSRVLFWMDVFSQLLQLNNNSFEDSLAVMSKLLSVEVHIYSDICLMNDFHHLVSRHCDERRKLRSQPCSHIANLIQCPFLNDTRYYNHVVHRLHVLLCHENEPLYRRTFDEQQINVNTYNHTQALSQSQSQQQQPRRIVNRFVMDIETETEPNTVNTDNNNSNSTSNNNEEDEEPSNNNNDNDDDEY
jgi:hypothetical protein